jgi:hypothetical protein
LVARDVQANVVAVGNRRDGKIDAALDGIQARLDAAPPDRQAAHEVLRRGPPCPSQV